MLSREENELLTRIGPGTAMGEAMRRYWIPALLVREIAEPDGPPARVRLLGEDLVAFSRQRRPDRASTNIVHIAAPRCFSGATRSAGCVASITAGNSPSTAAASTR
jgi:hypothetical protein